MQGHLLFPLSVPSLVLTGKETSACNVMKKGMGLKKCSPGNPASAWVGEGMFERERTSPQTWEERLFCQTNTEHNAE